VPYKDAGTGRAARAVVTPKVSVGVPRGYRRRNARHARSVQKKGNHRGCLCGDFKKW